MASPGNTTSLYCRAVSTHFPNFKLVEGMKIILRSFCLIIIILALNCSNVFAQENYSIHGAKQMLMEFYNNFISAVCNPEVSLDSLFQIKKKYCTMSYFQDIEKHEDLDYEPLLKAQDSDVKILKTLCIINDSINRGDFYISYIYPNNTPENSKTTIKLTVKKVGKDYKIDHVYLDY